MIDDGQKLGERLRDSLLDHPALGDAPAQIKAKADELVLTIQERFERARLTAENSRDELDMFVRARPYAALALAAFAGLVAGHMMSSARPNVILLKDARH